jgi:hypothetical protein
MVGRLIELALWGNSQTLPRSNELRVKIDKGELPPGQARGRTAELCREMGMSCNEKNMERRLSVDFLITGFPHDRGNLK